MYAIRMGTGKELFTTVRRPIYQGEQNVDDLVFIVPKKYDEMDIAACTVTLQYMLPETDDYVDLMLESSDYNDEFLACKTPLAASLTSRSGTVLMRLVIRDESGQTVLISGAGFMPVLLRYSDNPTEPLPDRDKLSKLAEKVENLSKEKADSLDYDTGHRKLHLTANGDKIGQPVTVPADDYACDGSGSTWGSMTDGENGDG